MRQILRLDYKCVQHTNVWLLKHLLRKLLVARQHYQAELCISKLLVPESYQCQGCKYIDLHAYLTFHMQTSRSHSFFQIPAGKTTVCIRSIHFSCHLWKCLSWPSLSWPNRQGTYPYNPLPGGNSKTLSGVRLSPFSTRSSSYTHCECLCGWMFSGWQHEYLKQSIRKSLWVVGWI